MRDSLLFQINHEVAEKYREKRNYKHRGGSPQRTRISDGRNQNSFSPFGLRCRPHSHVFDLACVKLIALSLSPARKIRAALIPNSVWFGQAVWHPNGNDVATVG